MAKYSDASSKVDDPLALSARLSDVAARSQRVIVDFLRRSPELGAVGDPAGIGRAFLDLTAKMLADPASLAKAQLDLWADQVRLWHQTTGRLFGSAERTERPVGKDRRFQHPAWTEHFVFDYIKQSYEMFAGAILSAVHSVEGLDPKAEHKVRFYTRQFVDAMAPSNFIATNPEVLQATIETGGENLLEGLTNLLQDLERGRGQLAITMTDPGAFRVGENVATTKGKVIFQNDLMQLIQYTPATSEVKRRPLLIIPPWINKFYILDLQPKNSFIKWAVDQGHTVFVMSWVNPDERLAHKGFEDYLLEGPVVALDVLEAATGEREVNAIGYCLGGTLLAATLSYLSAKNEDRIRSATYFVALVDFSNPGDLGVYIDEQQLAMVEKRMRERGYLEGKDMALAFNMLRANDLIWRFVVDNYLLGKQPPPFDLLYWNSDSTRMPIEMHSFYLRAMYHENRLARPGGISLAGVPIDLTRITTPTFMVSTREDHIAPWRSTYAATRLYRGPIKFVLAESGHIAGIINPPGSRYGHWHNPELPDHPDEWLQGADLVKSSWWLAWEEWVNEHSGGLVPAREAGGGGLQPIEDAPGSYVRVRAGD
jgi:poly[(R)-3-hydroxyalkanoate] polymerase subunit PhaC